VKPALLRIPRHWIVWTVILFALTFALGFAAKWIPALRFDTLDASVNRVNSPLLDSAALLLDQLDRPTIVAVILVVVFIILLFVKGWRLALGTCLVTGLGWLTTLVVKTVVAQPRPTTAGLSHLLHVNPATLSYPSGHVVFAAALVAALAMVCRSAASRSIVIVVGVVFVAVVAWSRLYVGVHYGTDVVGGVLNGVAGALLFAGLWNIVASRLFAGRDEHGRDERSRDERSRDAYGRTAHGRAR
jgi:undecaprenyl-diphosphatase